MSGTTPEPARDQSTAARISTHVVRTLSAYTGRGPTSSWTSIDGDLVAVVLRDTLTKGERILVQDGRTELVLLMRKAYQLTMREELVSGVEQHTGRKVIAFLSDNHIDPDISIESFILESVEDR
ncbi:MAG: Na-translocating system protein MpsC family protein [Solirubrobacteraceae bacterium]